MIGVDIFGLPAEYERIDAVAREHGLFVIEDAAQSFGAELNGKKACSFGNIACTSGPGHAPTATAKFAAHV